MNALVINWHITEACNFKCQYCFAKWQKPCKKELLRSDNDVSQLIEQFQTLLTLINHKYQSHFEQIRLNLVGGETFLYRSAIKNITMQAKKHNMILSAITNGSKLTPELNQIIANQFKMIGFSIDSIKDNTNLLIGRQTNNKAMDYQLLLRNIEIIRSINPTIQIKINTVVNKHNYSESLSEFISQVKPTKWKIFKVLPIINDALSINDQQFHYFLENHREFENIISAENNEEMTHSYLMVDPSGRFFQNIEQQTGYQYSEPILSVGIEKAFQQIPFEIVKFLHRYH